MCTRALELCAPVLLTKRPSRFIFFEASGDTACAYGRMSPSRSKVPVPRFYFNIVAGDGTREDLEGSELPSLEHARTEAIEDVRGLMSNAILLGQDISSRRIEICNEEGNLLLTLLFTDAITSVA